MKTDQKLENEITKIFEDTSYELELILIAAIISGQLGSTQYFNQQRGKIINAVSKAKNKATPLIVRAVKEQYMDGSKKALQWLAAFFGTDIAQGFSAKDQRAVELLVQSTLKRFDTALATMANSAEQTLSQEALDSLSDIAKNDRSIKKTGRQLKRALTRAGVTSKQGKGIKSIIGPRFIKVNGRNYNAKKYSELVVRTESNRAYNQGVLERMTVNNYDVVAINATSATCNLCSEYDDGTYSLTGATAAYPVLGAYPPYHPGCQHFIEPVLA